MQTIDIEYRIVLELHRIELSDLLIIKIRLL